MPASGTRVADGEERRAWINQSFTSASMQEYLKRETRRYAFQLASGKDET